MYIYCIVVIVLFIIAYKGITYYTSSGSNFVFSQIKHKNFSEDTHIISEVPYKLNGVIKIGDSSGLFNIILDKNNSNIFVTDEIFKNDKYNQYNIKAYMNGLMTLNYPINNIKKSTEQSILFLETPQHYSMFTHKRAVDCDRQWVINIFKGISEANRIIYNNNDYVLLPNMNYTNDVINELHCLILFKNPMLMSIRDLRKTDIDLLDASYKNSLEQIEKRYGLAKNKIIAYFHYYPTVWQLHMHLVNIDYKQANSSIEYSHNIINVIRNLKLDSMYYANATLQVVK